MAAQRLKTTAMSDEASQVLELIGQGHHFLLSGGAGSGGGRIYDTVILPQLYLEP